MNTLEFTVLNHQYWQYMFHTTCFWYSPNRSSLVLQDRAIKRSGTPETPNAIQNLKISLLTERCFHTDCHPAQYCAGAAVTQHRSDVSSHDTVPRHTHFCITDISWPTRSPHLAVPNLFLWVSQKTRYRQHPLPIL